MRLPSESKQQLFLKNLIPENALLSSGLGITLGVMATVNTDQAFFVGSLALAAIIINSLLASVSSDIFHLKPARWVHILLTACLLSALVNSFNENISRMPPLTPLAVLTLSVSPLPYARAKAMALNASPGRSLFDAAGSGLGLMAAMLGIALIREILGSGSLGSVAIFATPPLPLLEQTIGGFLITAFAMILYRFLFSPTPTAP